MGRGEMGAMSTTDAATDTSPARALTRRRALSLLGIGGVGLVTAACASSSSSSGSAATGSAATAGTSATTAGSATTAAASATTAGSATTAATTAAASGDLTVTPTETGGPFPADGSNDNGEGTKADMLADARTVRKDIRGDLDGSNVQPGVPMTLTMTVLDDTTGKALSGAAVYIWHCNAAGVYSQYNSRMLGGDYSERSYLRGVQITDANGIVNFQTILPGRYQGRAFHFHFEVFSDSTYKTKLLTSQIAVDDDQIDALYAEAGSTYASALRNDTDNSADGVFRDGVDHQLMKLAGSVSSGLAATFTAVV